VWDRLIQYFVQNFIRKTEGKRPGDRLRVDARIILKWIVQEWKAVNSSYVAERRDQWRVFRPV
jgi:hypothetical protein